MKGIRSWLRAIAKVKNLLDENEGEELRVWSFVCFCGKGDFEKWIGCDMLSVKLRDANRKSIGAIFLIIDDEWVVCTLIKNQLSIC